MIYTKYKILITFWFRFETILFVSFAIIFILYMKIRIKRSWQGHYDGHYYGKNTKRSIITVTFMLRLAAFALKESHFLFSSSFASSNSFFRCSFLSARSRRLSRSICKWTVFQNKLMNSWKKIVKPKIHYLNSWSTSIWWIRSLWNLFNNEVPLTMSQ